MVHHVDDFAPLMVERQRGMRVTGIEALVALAHALDCEAFEIACEDARVEDLAATRTAA